ncbi:hypothetical protein JQC67_08765 [Aurantibacter crassamenti]|uniref:hypothetical protein n=1 Tax=Aurantibacter crassamenti TaxID=1837375 RepID=UPI00193A3B25|nr:hypothetical protein [Aurantibacter crassamenti]MBM1106225.1 hypothetical protein [Aurantibacter crassamenti]
MFESKNFKILLLFVFIGLLSCSSDSPTTNPVPEVDTDGDGILDSKEITDGTDKNNACDPIRNSGYTAFSASNSIWAAADCDNDGVTNGAEVTNGTDPYIDDLDTDGDGLLDSEEIADGTDKNNPCDPVHDADYDEYNATNANWAAADCDGDGVINGDEVLNSTDPYVDDREYAVAELLPNLSELKVFDGPLEDLKFNRTAHEYSLITPLYTDYAYKLRSISLPKNAKMTYNGEGLLAFPDNTVITKTFYYLNDERDATIGKKIIETRVLIKKNGSWVMGEYIWNDAQTEAILEESDDVKVVLVDYKNTEGEWESVAYEVPNMTACIQCHNNNGTTFPIGPKSRNMNFEYLGKNQIEYFVDKNMLTGAPAVNQIAVLPDWESTSETVENRARAYMEVNCAHCHQPGGFNGNPVVETLDFRFETPYTNTNISAKKADIIERINSGFPNFSMPYTGTTIKHTEGISLIEDYIDSLD